MIVEFCVGSTEGTDGWAVVDPEHCSGGETHEIEEPGPSHAVVALGAREAIFSYGALSFRGRWVWRLKDWIDRRFIAKGSCGV